MGKYLRAIVRGKYPYGDKGRGTFSETPPQLIRVRKATGQSLRATEKIKPLINYNLIQMITL